MGHLGWSMSGPIGIYSRGKRWGEGISWSPYISWQRLGQLTSPHNISENPILDLLSAIKVSVLISVTYEIAFSQFEKLTAYRPRYKASQQTQTAECWIVASHNSISRNLRICWEQTVTSRSPPHDPSTSQRNRRWYAWAPPICHKSEIDGVICSDLAWICNEILY